jgi:hypothetical protein
MNPLSWMDALVTGFLFTLIVGLFIIWCKRRYCWHKWKLVNYIDIPQYDCSIVHKECIKCGKKKYRAK